MAKPPDSTKTSCQQKLAGRARERWPQLAGILWGIPIMMTIDDAAQRMNISISRAHQIYDNSIEAIRPEWEASPEYHMLRDPGV
jgi:hypothetical protein